MQHNIRPEQFPDEEPDARADSRAIPASTVFAAQTIAQATPSEMERLEALVSSGAQLFWTTNAEGLVDDIPFYRTYTGQSAQAVKGQGWLQAVHPDDRPQMAELWAAALATRTPIETELRLRRADGDYRHFMVRGVPILRADGVVREWVGFCTDITERIQAEQELQARVRQAALAADVGRALTSSTPLRERLQRCSEAVVQHLDAAFARIWTVNEGERVLELQASAGIYTHIDGGHSRVPIGSFKIGIIAQERKPHLTNQVVGDERVHNQAWAVEEGMVAFAGYPLIAGEQMVGVLALFARQPLTESTLTALAAIADEVALAIEQARVHEHREHLLSIVSHELKTPLTSVKALIQVLRRRLARGQMVQDTQLEHVEQSVNRMDRLVNDLLDATRVETEQLRLETTTCDIGALCKQAAAEQMRATKRTITVTTPAQPISVQADANRVMQVLHNLLSNALKYSPPATLVTMTVQRRRNMAYITVRDQGAGIPPEAQPRLFERFYRVPGVQVLSGSGVGLGLGLYLCRRLIERQQGQIGVESTPGAETIFWFTLPLASA